MQFPCSSTESKRQIPKQNSEPYLSVCIRTSSFVSVSSSLYMQKIMEIYFTSHIKVSRQLVKLFFNLQVVLGCKTICLRVFLHVQLPERFTDQLLTQSYQVKLDMLQNLVWVVNNNLCIWNSNFLLIGNVFFSTGGCFTPHKLTREFYFSAQRASIYNSP